METNNFFVSEKIPEGQQKRRHKLKAIGRNLLEETTKLFQSGHDAEFRRRLETGVITLRCNENWIRRQFT